MKFTELELKVGIEKLRVLHREGMERAKAAQDAIDKINAELRETSLVGMIFLVVKGAFGNHRAIQQMLRRRSLKRQREDHAEERFNCVAASMHAARAITMNTKRLNKLNGVS